MTSRNDQWSGVSLSQNMLLLVYPFAVDGDPGLPLLQRPFAALQEWTAADFQAALGSEGGFALPAGKPIWEPLAAAQAKKHLSPDLHSVVDRILHGGSSAPGKEVDQAHLPFRLCGDFLKDDFAIELPEAAANRLKKAGAALDGGRYIRFRFHDIHAYLFATRIGLLTLEIEIKAPIEAQTAVSADLLLEGIYALSHPENRGQSILHGRLHKKPALEKLEAGGLAHVVGVSPGELLLPASEARYGLRRCLGGSLGAAEPRGYSVLVGVGPGEPCLVQQSGWMDKVTIGSLAQALLGGVAADNHDSARFFSFAYARMSEGVPAHARMELAFRLSGNYNSHYAVSPAEVVKKTQVIFNNIYFAATLQGGSVVVGAEGEDAPSHLLAYYQNAVRCSYIPLGLLAYHEYLQLKNLLRNCAVPCATGDLEAEAARIKLGREKLLNFRLYYRFSHVSDMAHHNTVHGTWRSALSLDTMLQELSTDMVEADNVYMAAVKRREEQHWREEQNRYEQDKKERREKEALEKKRQHDREESWKWATTLAAAFGGFTFIHEVAEIVLRLFFPAEKWFLLLFKGDGVSAEALEHDPRYQAARQFHEALHNWEMWIAIGAAVLAIGVGWVAWRKGPKLGHH